MHPCRSVVPSHEKNPTVYQIVLPKTSSASTDDDVQMIPHFGFVPAGSEIDVAVA
jgi:hypothetical protein